MLSKTSNLSKEFVKDAILLTIAGCALILEILVLMHQMRVIHLPVPWKDRASLEKPIGQVIEKRNSLKNRAQTSLSWYPLTEGDAIHLNDTVLTGAESSARIRLDGEGELDLEADTLIKFAIEPSKENASVLNLELAQGLVRVKSKDKAVNLKLKTKDIALTPDTEVVFTKPTLGEQSQIQVKKGEVQIAQPGVSETDATKQIVKIVSIKAGEAIQVDADRGMARIETVLKLDPKFPKGGAALVSKGPMDVVGFFWDGDAGQLVEIDKKSDFSQPRQIRAGGNSAEVELAPGKYYWRTRRDLAVSSTQEFTLMPPVTYKLQPEEGQAFRIGSKVVLSWEPVEGAVHYSVEISPTRDFKQFFLQSDVEENKTEISGLKLGDYYWRLRAKHAELGSWPASPTNTFSIKRRLDAPKPKGVKLKPKKTSSFGSGPRFASVLLDAAALLAYRAAHAEQITVDLIFEWEPIKEAARYRLEVAEDKAFKTVLKTVEVMDPIAEVELPKRKKYYWRVAARDDEEYLHSYSSVQEMELPEEKPQVIAKKPPAPPPAPKPEPKRAPASNEPAPNGITVGATEWGQLQGTSEADFDVDTSGLSPALHLEVSRTVGRWEVEARGGFRSAYLEREDTGQKTFLGLWRGGLYAKSPWRVGMFRLAAGFEARNEIDFFRVDENNVDVRKIYYFPLMLGFTTMHDLGNRFLLQSDVFAELAPAGYLRGAGLMARGRLGYRMQNFLPELTATLYPSLKLAGPANRKTTSVAFALGLLFTVRIDDPI